VELHETIPVIYLEVDDEIVVRHAEMEVHEKREKTMRKIKKHMNMMMIALIGTRNMSDLKGEGPPGDFFITTSVCQFLSEKYSYCPRPKKSMRRLILKRFFFRPQNKSF
jgi:hypothetical protein